MPGIAMNGQVDQHKNEKPKLIGYRGYWYDISTFIPHHPGGEVIEKFIGQDATCVIDSMHKYNVLEKRKPVDESYEFVQRPFDRDMSDLEKKFKKEGFYDNSFWWCVRKCVAVLLFIAVNILFVWSEMFLGSYWRPAIAGVLLALFWQQSGMIMHDLMHSQMFRIKGVDEKLGVFYGTFCFGISARWWKDEHIIHHALTNTVDHGNNFVDPQANEELWVQNEKLFYFPMNSIKEFCVGIQHWIFLPLTVGLGRFAIVVDSLREERRRDVWLAWIFHWVWLLVFLGAFSNWREALFVYWCGCVGEGVLHIQLLLNHYAKRFYTLTEKHAEEYYRTMIDCNLNIVCPRWFDWFHGGLNFHHEHHCFPRLPRNRLREASYMIKEICAKHNVVYDECGFGRALLRVLRNFFVLSCKFQKRYSVKPKVSMD